MSDRLTIGVLMGGTSSEREVSLISGRAVLEAIDTKRFDAVPVDLRLGAELIAASGGFRGGWSDPISSAMPAEARSAIWNALAGTNELPDCVFIALHGRHGEDGAIQGLLELLGLPYTGSGILASALCMDKVATKRVISSCGIPTPEFEVCHFSPAGTLDMDPIQRLELPVIVKPDREGSTIGISIVREPDELAGAIDQARALDRVVLVEKLVSGMEITVGVLGNDQLEVLPSVEIVPKSGFYDYESKYTPGLTEKICPARLDAYTEKLVSDLAARTHRVLGCSGMSRVDFIVTDSGPTVLEVNTIPGLTPTSLLPRAAQAAGYEFTSLISRIIDLGLELGVR